MTDNKQKIIDLVSQYSHIDRIDYTDLADEIDALYHRDCGKCAHNSKYGCGQYEIICMWSGSDYYMEATE